MAETHHYSAFANNTHAKWWKDPGMRMGFIHIFILYSAVYSLGYDGSLLNGLQALPAWKKQFNSPVGTDLGLIAATYYLPKIPLTFVIAWIIDRWGRKIALYLGALFMLAGAFAGGFANTRAQLMGSRVLLGAGTAAAQIAACAMVPELAHPRIRHWAGSFLNVTYFIGSIFAAWLTFAMVYYPGGHSWSWRVPTLVQGFGPVILALGTWFVPESPRWLVKSGREDEAHKILAKYHANGKMDDELVLFELSEIKTAVEVEEASNESSWLSFFKTEGNRRRFFVIILLGTATQWSGNGIISYFLIPVLKTVGITAPPQTAGINGGLSIWSWVVAITGASLVERAGRRTLFLTSFSFMFFCFVMMLGLSGGYAHTHHRATGLAMIPFIFLFNAGYALSLTPIPMLYVPEISRMNMRAKSAALLLLSQNCAQAFNQFVNPVALNAIGWKYYAVYVAVLGAYFILFFLFVRETRGLTTEEAAVVYESAEAREAALDAARREMRRQKAEEKLSEKDELSHEEETRRV
ncbi:Lactose permease [Vanrija pseudolonga]|uniref:Lactose permease n=1 Tax=Vanrija pseudolonga TaxID=143232 RepID=A0AAF0YFK8_9TREE|nr:Lactose permease [Vanrija pseudolonga]